MFNVLIYIMFILMVRVLSTPPEPSIRMFKFKIIEPASDRSSWRELVSATLSKLTS